MKQQEMKYTLRNQTEEMNEFTKEDILEFLALLCEEPDEFVVLAAEECIDNISFVQAYWNGGMLHTEVGVPKGGNNILYEKDMSMEEGEKLFLDFYKGKWSGNLEEFAMIKRP